MCPDYIGVWHLSEDADGSVNDYRDSSPYGNHSRGGGGDVDFVPKQAYGKIGLSRRFDDTVDGDYDLIERGDDALFESRAT